MRIGTIAALFIVGAIVGVVADEAIHATSDVRTPQRPPVVPATAQWAGGASGGNWFDCTQQAEGTYRCAVYADVTGVLIVKGLYKLEARPGEIRPVLFASDREIQINGATLVKAAE